MLYFIIIYIYIYEQLYISLKRFIFYKVPLSTSTVCSDWPTGTVHCDWPNTTSRVGNVTPLSIIASFSFQYKSKDKLIMSLVLPSVQAWEGNRVTWQTQWWSSYVFANKPRLWCDHVSLSRTREHTHTHTHTHTRRAKLCIWTVNSKCLN